jgi:two-component SAPR family response regulator
VLLADTDRTDTERLVCVFKKNYGIRPQVWRNERAFHDFIRIPENGVVFVRIDDPSVPGLELTRQATAFYPQIQLVWMAANEGYAIEAFPRGVDEYLLLPATEEKLAKVMDSLKCKKERHLEK